MQKILIADAISTLKKGYIYARAGTRVRVIAIHGNVSIVEVIDQIKKRFPINNEKLA